MGVYLSYYSIPPKQLEQFLRYQNEEQIFTSLLQERRQFPYTLHHIDVYAYGAIHYLLAPSSMPTVILKDVIEGAEPFRLGSDQDANVMYLQQPRYLDTPTVKKLTDAMLAISFAELIERFAAMEQLATTTDPLIIAKHPAYRAIMTEFERLLCFFHIAATLNYSIIRWYSG